MPHLFFSGTDFRNYSDTEVELDHVAIGLWEISDSFPFFSETLQCRKKSAVQSLGYSHFDTFKVKFENGALIELLQPAEIMYKTLTKEMFETFRKQNFLARFLRRGPRPHHITFFVPNIFHKIKRAESLGFKVVGKAAKSQSIWSEAFVHPAQSAVGVVVQLAEFHPERYPMDPTPFFKNWAIYDPYTDPESPLVNLTCLHLVCFEENEQQSESLWGELLQGQVEKKSIGFERERIIHWKWPRSPMKIAIHFFSKNTSHYQEGLHLFQLDIIKNDANCINTSQQQTLRQLTSSGLRAFGTFFAATPDLRLTLSNKEDQARTIGHSAKL
eukprot:TRINITY_DN11842_c0_g1_i1.p1 TRINITY_DN11842_c0_g1~~TRINITY_DN11842_c0_g1_i1.p1  ORF type:complete len:328 (+),score=35.27 TRINITY_DN11842_c0_g1_i1:21-1004(+)